MSALALSLAWKSNEKHSGVFILRLTHMHRLALGGCAVVIPCHILASRFCRHARSLGFWSDPALGLVCKQHYRNG